MAAAGKVTVLVASGSLEIRTRWEERLQDTYAICEVGELKALEQVMGNLKPQVLLLDLSLPGLRGVRGIPQIERVSLSTKIIALTENCDDSEGLAALEAGAKGYCRRDIGSQQVRKAVDAIERGEIWIQRRLAAALLTALRSVKQRFGTPSVPEGDPLHELTPRERQVGDLITKGASNKEIARHLNISERTVKAHLTEMFRDLHVTDRLQLAVVLNGAGMRSRLLAERPAGLSLRRRTAAPARRILPARKSDPATPRNYRA